MRFLIAALFLALSTAAMAAEDHVCRNGLYAEGQTAFRAGTVTGTGVALTMHDQGECPSPLPRCVSRSGPAAGTLIVVGRTYKQYACVYYFAGDNGSAGWLPISRTRLREEPAPQPAAWTGVWRDGDNQVRLTAMPDGSLLAKGDAYWPQKDPPIDLVPGGAHLGEMSGRATPEGRHVRFIGREPEDCAVDLWLAGPFLIGRDNAACGGTNVTFTTVYRR